MASPTSHDLILSRKLSKMIDNSNNLNNRLSGSITGLRERNVNSGVPDRDEIFRSARINCHLRFCFGVHEVAC